jgi:hypothetical protein
MPAQLLVRRRRRPKEARRIEQEAVGRDCAAGGRLRGRPPIAIVQPRNRGEVMTIAELGAALRGIPRDTRLLIDTPDGLKELRLVQATHTRDAQNGSLAASTRGAYAMVLYREGREP